MKKIIKLVLCTALLSVSLVGCGENKHGLDADNPVTISIWHYYNGQQLKALDSMISEFNDSIGKEQGIIVDAVSKTSINDLYDALSDSADKKVGSDELPDLFSTYVDYAYVLDNKGLLASLDQYFSDGELKTYNSAYIEEGRFGSDKSLKVFPVAKATEIMLVNDTDFQVFAKATGVKYEDLETVEGLVEVSKKYYEYTDGLTPNIKNDGKAFFGRDSLSNYMLLGAKQLGEDVYSVDKDGKVSVNLSKEVAKKLWDSYYVPYISGYFLQEGRYRSDDAKTGDILSFVGSSTGATYFPNEVVATDGSTHEVSAKTVIAPIFKDGEKYAVQQGAGLAVTKSNETKEYAACVFLKWFTEEEQNVEFSMASSYLPVKNSISTFDSLSSYADKAGVEVKEKAKESIEVSLNTIANDKLYVSPAFDTSNAARTQLGDSIEKISKENRKKVQAELSSSSLEDAVKKYNTDEVFNNWYDQLIKDLKAIVE